MKIGRGRRGMTRPLSFKRFLDKKRIAAEVEATKKVASCWFQGFRDRKQFEVEECVVEI